VTQGGDKTDHAAAIDLEPLKSRLAAATPGPWEADESRTVVRRPGSSDSSVANVLEASDTELIAHAPADIAALIAEVERLRAVCETAVREMERYYRDGSHPDLSPVLKESKAALGG